MALDWIATINGKTLDTLGLAAVTPAPSWDFAGVRRQEHGVVGSYGTVPDRSAVGRPKEFTLRLVVKAEIAARQAGIDALLAELDGLIEVRFGHAADRAWWGRLDTVPISARWEQVAMVDGDVVADCRFVVPDGTARGPGKVLSVGSTATDVVGLGVAPSAPLYIIDGSATNPEITYRTPGGDVLSSLALTGSLTSDEYLEIDGATSRITKGTVSTGARALDMRFWGVGAGSVPELDPGDSVGSSPPTLEIDSGSLTVYYVPRYPA